MGRKKFSLTAVSRPNRLLQLFGQWSHESHAEMKTKLISTCTTKCSQDGRGYWKAISLRCRPKEILFANISAQLLLSECVRRQTFSTTATLDWNFALYFSSAARAVHLMGEKRMATVYLDTVTVQGPNISWIYQFGEVLLKCLARSRSAQL